MQTLRGAVSRLLLAQAASGRPLAIVLAGHNGSGKSTLWREKLAPRIRIPLVNADRMMMSILPEPTKGRLPSWAAKLRDDDESWMKVAQQGVQAFVAQALANNVPFAMETVFSHWLVHPDGRVESKLDMIRQMQAAGYFVVLIFVGLSSAQLSIGRVATRVALGGHAVGEDKLLARFPRTQKAIDHALEACDAALLTDNSRSQKEAFTVCRVQLGPEVVYDLRGGVRPVPPEISRWLGFVAPRMP